MPWKFGGIYEGVVDRMTHGKTTEQQIEEGYEGCGIAEEERDFAAFRSAGIS